MLLYCFCCFSFYLRAISKYKPLGAYIQRDNLTEGFCVVSLRGLYLEWLIHGGAYFRNFTIVGNTMQFQGRNLLTSPVCSIVLQTLTDDTMNPLKSNSSICLEKLKFDEIMSRF